MDPALYKDDVARHRKRYPHMENIWWPLVFKIFCPQSFSAKTAIGIETFNRNRGEMDDFFYVLLITITYIYNKYTCICSLTSGPYKDIK